MMHRYRGIIFVVTNILFFSTVPPFFAQEQKTGKEPIVLIHTDYGDIKIKLYNETPLHRDNFIKLASQGKYDGSIFHRVIPSFMIQGGGAPGSNGQESSEELISAEFVVKYFHKRGALAAARMPDNVNPQKKSSGLQFYIVQGRKFSGADLDMMEQKTGIKFSKEQRQAYTTIGGTPHLDGNYTVFGEVIEGMDAVDKIASVETYLDKPVTDIKMSMKVIR